LSSLSPQAHTSTLSFRRLSTYLSLSLSISLSLSVSLCLSLYGCLLLSLFLSLDSVWALQNLKIFNSFWTLVKGHLPSLSLQCLEKSFLRFHSKLERNLIFTCTLNFFRQFYIFEFIYLNIQDKMQKQWRIGIDILMV